MASARAFRLSSAKSSYRLALVSFSQGDRRQAAPPMESIWSM